jgi:hypothetical protein
VAGARPVGKLYIITGKRFADSWSLWWGLWFMAGRPVYGRFSGVYGRKTRAVDRKHLGKQESSFCYFLYSSPDLPYLFNLIPQRSIGLKTKHKRRLHCTCYILLIPGSCEKRTIAYRTGRSRYFSVQHLDRFLMFEQCV